MSNDSNLGIHVKRFKLTFFFFKKMNYFALLHTSCSGTDLLAEYYNKHIYLYPKIIQNFVPDPWNNILANGNEEEKKSFFTNLVAFDNDFGSYGYYEEQYRCDEKTGYYILTKTTDRNDNIMSDHDIETNKIIFKNEYELHNHLVKNDKPCKIIPCDNTFHDLLEFREYVDDIVSNLLENDEHIKS